MTSQGEESERRTSREEEMTEYQPRKNKRFNRQTMGVQDLVNNDNGQNFRCSWALEVEEEMKSSMRMEDNLRKEKRNKGQEREEEERVRGEKENNRRVPEEEQHDMDEEVER